MRISDGKLTLTRLLVAFIFAMFSRALIFEYVLNYDGTGWASFFADLTSQIIMLLVFWSLVGLSLYPNRIPFRSILRGNQQAERKPNDIFIFSIICLATVFLRYCINMLVAGYSYLFQPQKMLAIALELQKRGSEKMLSSFAEFSPALLNIVLTAPICEEIIYRGFILNFLLSRYKANAAIILSAAIFALFHGGAYPSAFLGGIYLGILYVKFARLDICIIAHMTANTLMVFLESSVLGHYPFNVLSQNTIRLENLLPAIALGLGYTLFVLYCFVQFKGTRGKSSFLALK